jgi:drug/metabolite transporter (DMT)-like permease
MVAGFTPMTAAQVWILIGAGAGAALGQFGITAAYRFAAPGSIAVFDYTNIIFTAALGFLFFAQIPDLWSVLGYAAIILAAVSMSGSKKEKK